MGRKRSHTRRTPRANPRGILMVKAGGFGFVQSAEGEYFIPASSMGGAFDGDLVELAPLPSKNTRQRHDRHYDDGSGGAPAARVVRVLDRAHDCVVGRYEIAEPFGVVVPEDTRIPYDIFTMLSDYPGIPDGSLVRVRISQFPTRKSAATGVVEEVFGLEGEARVGVDLIVARHKLETEFSDAALREAASATLDEVGALAVGYRDARDRFVLTVDPADAKDFDDAISLEALEGQRAKWRLGVHIADVSHYVPWGSSIDFDARRRATSVYLVDRVIPMIPHELSDDLCSLKPHETRRSMTVDLYLDERAEVVDYDVYPALIESRARLSYEEAQELLDDETADGELAWRLKQLSRLAKLRAAKRTKAGGIDFSTTEAKVQLDGEGRPVDVLLRRKTDATELIEESMILANETVAAHLAGAKWPCMYRVHEKPSSDALAGLIPVFQEFPWFTDELALRLSFGDPRALQEILDASEARPEGELVSSLLLRSMKRAMYRPENDGHYGLASQAYAHFTSPIRRYPDLVVHRMLKMQLTKRTGTFDAEVNALKWLAEHSSDMERIADTAARESQELKMIEYLQAYVGTPFSAVISGVAMYGLYVRLENTAEGLLPVRSLGNEYFSFDPVRHCLMGQDSGRTFRLGQRVPVMLVEADPRASRLEFRLL